jgi:GAF domain-containing protein
LFIPFEKAGNTGKDDEVFLDYARALLSKEDSLITNMANLSSLLAWYLEDISWIGFYCYDGEVLRLGPFQGLPACSLIRLGKGVCGASAKQKATLNVSDVSLFPGYIACEGGVESELVVPLLKNDGLLGVLDADSKKKARFTKREEKLFEAVCQILSEAAKAGTWL